MPPQPISATENIAKQACRYAREYILEGTTQLINNDYATEKKMAIACALRDVREAANELALFHLEYIEALRKFEHAIVLSKKTSLGNCYELALMALDYVLGHAPNVEATAMCISGGDHVFLVIGSHCTEPNMWEDDTYICDPWSNKVYLAKHYLTETKNYYPMPDPQAITTGTQTNCIEDFNPQKHRLAYYFVQNTTYIRQQYASDEHKNKIVQLFMMKNERILAAVEKLICDLEQITARLRKSYGEQDYKYRVIIQKIDNLKAVVKSLKTNLNNTEAAGQSQREFKQALEARLRTSLNAYVKSTTLTKDDKEKLNRYHYPYSPVSLWMKFFNIPPKVSKEASTALTAANQAVMSIKQTDCP